MEKIVKNHRHRTHFAQFCFSIFLEWSSNSIKYIVCFHPVLSYGASRPCIELLLVQLELVELIFRFVAAQIFVSNCFSFPSFNPFVPRTQTIGERREFCGYCQRICFGFALVGNSFDHIGVW